MKKALIAYIFLCLLILYAVLLYNLAYDVNAWLLAKQRDWSDFLYFKKEDMVALLLVLLSLAGIFVRERNGWILTVTLFYALLGASITFVLKLNSSMQLVIILSMFLVLIPPILVMNSQTLKEFYKMDEPQNALLNNAIAILLAVLVSLFLW